MALEDFLTEEMRIQNKVSVPNGQGSFVWDWQDGAPFWAGIVKKQSTQMQIAEQQGMKTVYTIVTQADVELKAGDYARRARDNAIFKITGDASEMRTPGVSAMDFLQVPAVRGELGK